MSHQGIQRVELHMIPPAADWEDLSLQDFGQIVAGVLALT